MQILNTVIPPGKTLTINMEVAKLHTRTKIHIPIIVSRSTTEGPVLLLMGGIHGDEINGIEIVRRIIHKKLNRPQVGTVICIPVFNVFGFLNLSRQFPDGRDLNRVFPGSANGSLAARFAHAFTKNIVPVIDYAIDFHTGGAERNNAPQIRCVMQEEKSLELAKAFGAPFVINSQRIPKSVRQTMYRFQKISLLYEGGKSGSFDEKVIKQGVSGALNVMKTLGMIDGTPNPNDVVLIQKSKWHRAAHSGMFHNRIENGSKVQKNQILGTITDPYGEFEHVIKSNHQGHIICINTAPIVNRGDALYHISTDLASGV